MTRELFTKKIMKDETLIILVAVGIGYYLYSKSKTAAAAAATQTTVANPVGTIGTDVTTGVGFVGATNNFQNGQGQTVSQGFEQLTAKNFNPFPIAALVWVGFEDFINDQLILNQTSTPQVTYATQPIATGAAGNIQIPDISGQAFTDINGKAWYAIARTAIVISNIGSNPIYLQKYGSTSATANAVLQCPAGQPIAHNASGNFTISVGGAGVPAIVSEIYSAIAA